MIAAFTITSLQTIPTQPKSPTGAHGTGVVELKRIRGQEQQYAQELIVALTITNLPVILMHQ
jgi:hypothetical protein